MIETRRAASRFSVIHTQIEEYQREGRQAIRKSVRPNVNLPCSLADLKILIDEYIDVLIAAGFDLPAVFESYIDGDSIVYICEHAGLNVVELYPRADELLNSPFVLSGILRHFRLAQISGVAMDPHPKNFVFDGARVRFVDFSPPYHSNVYKDMRLNLARGAERALIESNFSAFEPQVLGYHFIGDFLNIGWTHKQLERLYPYLADFNLVEPNQKVGLARARRIRRIEDERLAKNIFLM